MQPISRRDAKASGLIKYFTGKPCPAGHVDERFVSNFYCCTCARLSVDKYQSTEAGQAALAAYAKSERGKQVARASKQRYRAKPDTRLKERETSRKWVSRPDVAERIRAGARERSARAEAKVALAEYRSRPSVAARIRERDRERGRSPENRARVRKWQSERLRTDPQFRLAAYLRVRIGSALKGRKKVGSAVELLGCSVEAAKLHLERQFLPGMTWDNWSLSGWHVDHIKPLSSFDLTDPTQLAAACHYTNLQPLWALDNIKKGAKITDAGLRANISGGGP